MNLFYNIIFIFLLIKTVSCSRIINDQKIILQEITNITDSVCSQLDISASTSTIEYDKKITIHIHFIDHYPLTEESHKVFNSLLLFELDSLATIYDTIEIARTYEDLVGWYSQIYLKEQVHKIQIQSLESLLFTDIAIYTFKNLNNYELLGFEDIIIDLRVLIPDKFKHNGSFWLLLYNYSYSCCDTSSIPYKSMQLVRKSSHYPGRPWRPDFIDSIIYYCKRDCELR